MEDANSISGSMLAKRVLALAVNAPWLEILAQSWKLLQKIWGGIAYEGIYEVLRCEYTLELLDTRGEHATVHKYQKVRYLQNSILAYYDQAWGDGEILLNYKCSPGVAVDQYRPGKTTYILISLREVKNRGDKDEFNIQWEQKGGYTRNKELWSAEISHRMQYIKLRIIFPSTRPPLRAAVVEDSTRKTTPLETEAIQKLPDGRYSVSWEISPPRLYETYALQWEW